jgi:hypothetical protein
MLLSQVQFCQFTQASSFNSIYDFIYRCLLCRLQCLKGRLLSGIRMLGMLLRRGIFCVRLKLIRLLLDSRLLRKDFLRRLKLLIRLCLLERLWLFWSKVNNKLRNFQIIVLKEVKIKHKVNNPRNKLLNNLKNLNKLKINHKIQNNLPRNKHNNLHSLLSLLQIILSMIN